MGGYANCNKRYISLDPLSPDVKMIPLIYEVVVTYIHVILRLRPQLKSLLGDKSDLVVDFFDTCYLVSNWISYLFRCTVNNLDSIFLSIYIYISN